MLHFVTILINYTIANWPAISTLVGGGAGLSIILQYVLHKLHVDSKKLAFTLLHLLSLLSAVSAYYLANTNVLPAYAGLVIAAQVAHRFFVSPYYDKYVLPYLTFLSESAPTVASPVPLAVVPIQGEQSPAFVN